MKKALTVFLAVAAALCTAAQTPHDIDMGIKQFDTQKVNSGREYYGDIPLRTTKVVIAGDNSMTDLLFKNAVEENWDISPFEFCSYEEFEQLRTDTSYYFLLRAGKMLRKDNPQYMESVCFLKGNSEAGTDMSRMPELIALPMFPENDDSDRIFTYLPAYMNIIQSYIQRISEGRIYPSRRGMVYPSPLDMSGTPVLLISEPDMACDPTPEDLGRMFSGKASITCQEDIDQALEEAAPETLVTLTVAAPAGSKGAMCYKMVIGADTYGLYYFKKHRLTPRKGPGLLRQDLRRISRMMARASAR
ncbi:MAG TPA: hypothetical protein IAC03_02070 [Candidatus Coprenecus pullistercoris]|nr:hypothetical protein [Candidatus Coprenecus pullistercoris]